MIELQVVRFRIRLRLRSGNILHDRLTRAIQTMLGVEEDKVAERNSARAEIVDAAESIIQNVWAKIKKGR